MRCGLDFKAGEGCVNCTHKYLTAVVHLSLLVMGYIRHAVIISTLNHLHFALVYPSRVLPPARRPPHLTTPGRPLAQNVMDEPPVKWQNVVRK